MNHAIARPIVLAAVVCTMLILSASYYWPVNEPYHPLNTSWNGCSTFFDAGNSTMAFSYDMLRNQTSLLAIIGPSVNFTAAEGGKVKEFMFSGGTVLLADDFGTGNSLLSALSVNARLSGKPLADLYFYSKNPSFVLVHDFARSPLTENIRTVLMDRPSYVEIENSTNVDILAVSSPFSFVNSGEEGAPISNATIASYPLMVKISVGNGMLILVSDPGVFLNEIIGLYDNTQLAQNLRDTGTGKLFFDVSHLVRFPLTDWRITIREGLGSVQRGISDVRGSMFFTGVVVAAIVVTITAGIVRAHRRIE